MKRTRTAFLLFILAVLGLGAGGLGCSGGEECLPELSFDKAGTSGSCGCNDDGDCPVNQICEFGLCGCASTSCTEDSDCDGVGCQNNCCLTGPATD